MRRILLILAAVLAALVLMDEGLRERQQARLQARATLRPLIGASAQIVPERVGRVTLQFADQQAFSYVRDGDLWRFPAYHNALAHTDRLERLLQVSLGSLGTLFTTDPAAHAVAGLHRPTLRLLLFDRSEQALAELRFAGPLPGPGGGETYAQIAGSDTVLHLHGDPISLIGRGRPPMLDPHLLPRSLPRSAWVKIEVTTTDAGSWQAERVLAPITADAVPLPRNAEDRYLWLMQQGTRVDTCHTSSVAAYIGYLHRVRVDGLTSWAASDTATATARLRLTDEDGRVEQLISRPPSAPSPIVVNERAGIAGLVSAARAAWLTPPAQVLLDSLQQPTPFDRALQNPSGATP